MLFVDSLDDPELTRDDYHHISKVLRTPDGAPIVVCDGSGGWRRATLSTRPGPTGDIERVEPRSPRVIVAFALIKGDRPELITQKLTELGVDEIVPLTTDNGVVRWKGEKAVKQRERLERIAREASMQCRRTVLPVVAAERTFDDLVADYGDVVRCDVGGVAVSSLFSAGSPGAAPWVVAIGPEGGWTDRERQLSSRVASIGDHILRAETAAIAAATLVTALRSGR